MKCPTCDGSGKVRNDGGGNCDPVWVDCPTCDGKGDVPSPPESGKEGGEKKPADERDG